MTQIDTSDSRFAKAIALADQAGQWAKCRSADGRKAYGVPSQSTPNRYHLTTQTSCTCEDTRRHPGLACKHRIAVAIHCARLAGKSMPASDVLDGLEQLVAEHHPLTPVRHPDGEITWERPHQHPAPDPETVRLAEQYTRIFSRFENDAPEQLFGRL